MKKRVADYIVDFLLENDINQCFTVTGGGAMFLNDAFGHNERMHCIYNHHEQASAMAAEAYARVNNKIAVTCVTTGPGATNAITGVAGAWMDSIPMIVLSGQVRYATSVYSSGLNLRTRGIQEFDIIGSVKNMTKYSQLLDNPHEIKMVLEKALCLARDGRPGPVWIDIPLDVQSAEIETDDLEGYKSVEHDYDIDNQVVDEVVYNMLKAKRPLIFAGNGIRLAGAYEEFRDFIEKYKIPVVTGMSSVDAMETDHLYYVGRNGTTGDRAGNFAIQNCDFLLSLGSRQSFFQTGFNYKLWAPNAFKVLNDIDEDELKKDSLNGDINVCGDVMSLLKKLNGKDATIDSSKWETWIEQCKKWKKTYPVVQQKHYDDKHANIYCFYNEMTKLIPETTDIVVSVGTSRVVGSQVSIIKKSQRFFTNPSIASMGYDLPAAIGVCIARNKQQTILVTGDGSLQMNIQEFQTIVHNQLPIITFVMNNQGYHSIRMTQNNFFGTKLVGVGAESEDLSFPNLKKIATAYGIKYFCINNNDEMLDIISKIITLSEPCICEVMLSKVQITEPKVSSQRLENGEMISATLENMSPFLSEEELRENMIVKEDE